MHNDTLNYTLKTALTDAVGTRGTYSQEERHRIFFMKCTGRVILKTNKMIAWGSWRVIVVLNSEARKNSSEVKGWKLAGW